MTDTPYRVDYEVLGAWLCILGFLVAFWATAFHYGRLLIEMLTR